MTRYEAFTSNTWRDGGIAQIIVARIRDGGRAEIGFFLVDQWCLGVKDAFLIDDSSESELRELLRDRLPEDFRERLHPACAKKMIEGAVAYAASLGIDPARDFRKAKRVLTGLDIADCPETFTYGRDGKPFYCEGPDDTPERTERVLALLEKRLGPDGFDYELFEDDLDDDDADDEEGTDDDIFEARDALQKFFATRNKADLKFHEFAGLIAAVLISPNSVSPNAILTRFWGEDRHVWKDQNELSAFMADVMAYWNYVVQLFTIYAGPEGDDEDAHPIDVFPEDFPNTDDATQFAHMAGAVMDWCRGFTRATREWPEAWGISLERTDLKPHFELIRAWSDPEGAPENLGIISGANDPDPDPNLSYNRRLPTAVITLLRALRPHLGK